MSRTSISQHFSSWTERFHPGSPSFGRLITVLVITGLLGVVLYSAALAIKKGNDAKTEDLRVQHTLAATIRTHAALQATRDDLTTPEGIRKHANGNGMVASGEEVIRFATPEPSKASPAAPVKTDTVDSSLAGLMLAGLLLFILAFLCGMTLLLLRWRAIRKRRPAGMLTPRSELRRRRHAHAPAHES